MGNQQVQNKPTAAYVLSLLGGIFGLLGSLAFIAFGVIAYMAYSAFVTDFTGYTYYGGLFGWDWTLLLGFGIWILIASILIIVFAGKLRSEPMEHSKWGALILVFSIIGVASLLGFIGGIMALVYKPIPMGPQQQPYGYAPQPTQYSAPPQQQYYQGQSPPQQITRICPSCGRVVDENLKFCPHCGRQLG